MQITQIKQIGKSENYRIFLNESYALTLNAQTIYHNKLVVGSEVEKEGLEQMQFDSEKIVAFDRAIALLSKSSKTKKDIMDYLKQKGYGAPICNHVAEKLLGYGYVNDLAYAKAYVEKVRGQKGKKLIFATLRAKGIEKEVIEKALENVVQDNEIGVLCAKFMKNKDKTQENKQKLYRHLVAKGFSYDECSKAVGEYFGGINNDWY